MLTPTKLDKLPELMIKLMSELQDDIIKDICRRITKANFLTPSAEWQLYKANQLRLSSAEVNRRIARQLKVRERTVKELYTEAVREAIHEDAVIYREAIAEQKLGEEYGEKLSSYTRSVAFSNTLEQGLKNTNGLMRNLTNSMAAATNMQLSNAMDGAYLKVISGAFTPAQAIFEAVQKLGRDGIKTVSYDSGRTDQVDVAVRRAVLTGINKTCCDMQLGLADEMDCQLVEVTSHLGARPSHAEWQGKIYSLKRGHPVYPYFYDATGYGTGAGLGGWNCRHSFYPYFEGISAPANAPTFSKEENEEEYNNSQRQRALERNIRKSKRELAALDSSRAATSDPELKAKLDRKFEQKSVTLKRREEALKEHCRKTGSYSDSSRVRVDGFGKSVSQKAVWANKRYISSKNLSVHSEVYRDTQFKPKEYFESKDYYSKFTKLDGLNLISRSSVYKAAKSCVQQNYGKMSESMVVVDRITGKQIKSKSSDGLNVSFTLPYAKNGTYVIVHNHPNNAPLSIGDIVTASECKSIHIMLAASHDGTIYWLQIGEGQRLGVTNQMITDGTVEARILQNDWARSISSHNGDFYNVLKEWADRYNWKVGVIN